MAFGLVVYDTFFPMWSLFWQIGSSPILDLVIKPPETFWSALFLFAMRLGATLGLFVVIPSIAYTLIAWGYFWFMEEERKIPFHKFSSKGERAFFYGEAIYLYCIWVIIYKVLTA